MRAILEVHRIGHPGFYSFPGLGPFFVERVGYYARTRAELVGPFDSQAQAGREAYRVTARRLQPGRTVPPPFSEPRRLIDL